MATILPSRRWRRNSWNRLRAASFLEKGRSTHAPSRTDFDSFRAASFSLNVGVEAEQRGVGPHALVGTQDDEVGE
jgi:hypothetical protein